MELRDYQKRALHTIHQDLQQDDKPVLLQAIMGAGKTVIVCKLIEHYFKTTNRTFTILVHKQELVSQFYGAFHGFTDIPFTSIGIVCAGLSRKETNRRVTIGTIQTFIHIPDPYPASLLVIDEAHRITIGTNSQYDQIIHHLNALNPALRILGVTATPSRLGHGYIYGDKCAPGSQNLFPRLNHSVEYEGLKNQGWLVPLKGKVATHKSLTQDLENVSVSGDYVLQELGDTLSQQRHIQTAVDAIRLYTQDYKKICVFCCTIDHAKQLAKMLGDETTIVHSQLSPIERQINMQAWITGRSRIITSVNILTEGFDMPDLDCLIMVRPTLSSSLFLQSVGRVLRTSPGKDHGFLLDLTNNTAYFGTNLDNIKVTVPKSVQDMIKKDNELIKLCPMCEKEVHIALRKCPCGYEWPASTFEEAEKIPEMEDVDFERVEPEWHDIDKQVVDDHVGRKSRKRLGKMTLIYGQNIYHPKEVSLWFCLPDEYNGYAVEKARQLWKKVGKSKFPESVDEFLDSEFEIITEILLDENGDYPEIKEIKTVPF